jgi:long-chain acyl-CoA synthetase
MNLSNHDRPWLAHYPNGVPHDLDLDPDASLVELIDRRLVEFADRPAYRFLGETQRFGDIDRWSTALAGYWHGLGLVPGDRVAVMMPNTPQYAVAVAAILRAGLVVVNVNPLYTSRELQHQLKDSGSKALVILENFAHVYQACADATPVKHVVLAAMGDLLSFFKGHVVNAVVRHHKKLVPAFDLPDAVRFNDALARGRRMAWVKPVVRGGDMAVLQYTGGTTGVSKGAVLLHRNILANLRQAHAWHQPVLADLPANEQLTSVCALPLYHIFAFTVNLLLSWETGAKNILIPNPRDLPDVFKTLRKERFHSFPAVSTLFNGLVNHPDFHTVDWRHLRASVGGGMAVQRAVAQRWLEETGCPICEGYGLSETSPIASCNALTIRDFNGTIGLPLPNTRMKCVDDAGKTVPVGEPGEIVFQGPQLMAGYWQRPDETAKAMTADGFFRTGDIGTMDAQGFFKIVDRKKDMVLVSGFNVYPNEIEDIVALMPGVLECAVVGILDEKTGEAVKLVVVKKDPNLTEADVLDHCRIQLTSYKRPKVVVFQDSMPKTPVGKILRRELRGV